jgi:tagatose 1,6-diphosphate aldolase
MSLLLRTRGKLDGLKSISDSNGIMNIIELDPIMPKSFNDHIMGALSSHASSSLAETSKGFVLPNSVFISLFYCPYDSKSNDYKQGFVRAMGEQCKKEDLLFFLRLDNYDLQILSRNGLEYALKQPEIVRKTVNEFSKPEYNVDVLAVEMPVNVDYVSEAACFKGQEAYPAEFVPSIFDECLSNVKIPVVFLSNWTNFAGLLESLTFANESNSKYSGVIVGESLWGDVKDKYCLPGSVFGDWLSTEGKRRIDTLNFVLSQARSWKDYYEVLK